ncbi:MAG: Serine endoprotease DegS [Pseudomonadota bacterium]|jgi:S1-C subfamily serine protease
MKKSNLQIQNFLRRLLDLFALWSLTAIVSAQTLTTEKPDSGGERKWQTATEALVVLDIETVPDARSANTLGTERKGNGVLIATNWVLTIGYLILEADKISVTDIHGKKLPGIAAAYDHSTGFGLVKLLAPSKARPIDLGRARGVPKDTPVLVLGSEGVQAARIVDRRQFTGAWEYLIEAAIFTAPPIENWGGSALVDEDGELIGVGSLFMRDVTTDDRGIAGNMFVPIDLLRPILATMKETGRSGLAAKPWLGISTELLHNALVITRVSPDSPAHKSGLARGDIIQAVGDKTPNSRADLYTSIWALGQAGVEVPLTVQRGLEKKIIKVKSMDRMDFLKPKTMF